MAALIMNVFVIFGLFCNLCFADINETNSIATNDNILEIDALCWSSDVKRDCLDLYQNGCQSDGIYKIDPTETGRPIYAFCDMTYNGGGWTVIQRRIDENTTFFRDFGDYVNGFGDLRGNMWIGLDNIHKLTANTNDLTELYVYLESFENENRYAKYSLFYTDDALDFYKLHISGYYGTAGDSMASHNNMFFSAYDIDNDKASNHCAKRHRGAWWYNSCYYSNLNGMYLAGDYSFSGSSPGMTWRTWKGLNYSLKTSIMKVRRH